MVPVSEYVLNSFFCFSLDKIGSAGRVEEGEDRGESEIKYIFFTCVDCPRGNNDDY